MRKVKDFIIENTGGSVYVAWGGFEDGTFFAISSDLILIYDEDEYKAMDTDEYKDGYEWQLKHIIDSYSFEMDEYKDIQRQIYNRCTAGEKMVDIFWDIDE